MKDPYLYPGTSVLKNKANIRDAEELKLFESENVKMRMLTVDKIESGYAVDGYEHLKAIHEHLFERVYDWAGKERIINTFKEEAVLGGRGSVEYTEWMDIPRYAQSALNALQKTPWNELTQEQKAEKFCDAVIALWQVHPFREGNTRTVITFSNNLAKEYGFRMDEKLLAQSSEYLRNALVVGTLGKKEYLYKIVKDSIERGKSLPFDNENNKLKYERLQEIRDCQQITAEIKGYIPSPLLYNIHAKQALIKSGNIWRKDTDRELYLSMLKEGVQEHRIKDIIKTYSPELIGKSLEYTTNYIEELKHTKNLLGEQVQSKKKCR